MAARRGRRRWTSRRRTIRRSGGAIGSGVGALFVQQHLYRPLFLAAAGLSVLVVITAALTRARYPGSVLATPVEELAGS